ncbi:CDP-glycerol glycerophosphotransferase family protein [Escherichia coli]|uniref:CDP-glycerol glycerophosphotransferase family protein n=1 Tax=Escherichia coli TaxID=562 RepID=UPI0028E0E9BD|nr:CDP-glycerol glycerophosphotransferase family protein [Escherichia coli]MDT9414117.1 CDP-glycerol glycerophosphotransferase family protein [Escherichia coli]
MNIPDYIKIGDLSTGSIQTAFKDADLLITDYSSVAFDIAYMKKPIIYFQFDSDTFFCQSFLFKRVFRLL